MLHSHLEAQSNITFLKYDLYNQLESGFSDTCYIWSSNKRQVVECFLYSSIINLCYDLVRMKQT